MIESFLQRTPFFRAVIPFATGIAIAGSFTGIEPGLLATAIILMFVIAWFTARKGGFLRNQWSGVVFSLFFLLSGITLFSFHSKEPYFPESEYYQATILELPDERPKSYRAEVKITRYGMADSLLKAKENAIVYFAKDDSSKKLLPGNQIVFLRNPQPIVNDANPFAFDFSGYMKRRGIYRQVWLPSGGWINAGNSPKPGLWVKAGKLRSRLLGIYRKNGLDGDEFAILSALTLGYRKSLDPEVRQTFANSGAMHVLAVSGLHVGIIFLVFRLIFSFMKRSRWGRFGYIMFAITLLWAYAFLTGLSPSVQRAAVRFSLVQIGDGLRRPVNIYNTLAASAMILLMVNPLLLFEVGFQLSYSAVMGIVYFQPRIEKLAVFRNMVLQKSWSLFAVSVAAQIGTFAVSSFYFKQFPVWFWITNFVVIPAAFILILLAALILVFSVLPVISTIIAQITGWMVSLIYYCLKQIENLPFSVYSGYNFDVVSLIISLLSVFAIILFIETRKKAFLFSFMMLTAIFIINSTLIRIQQNSRKELIVYDLNEPVIHLIAGRNNYLVVPEKSAIEDFPPFAVGNVIKAMRLHEPVVIKSGESYIDELLFISGNLIFFSDSKVLLISGKEIFPENIEFDYIIDFQNNLNFVGNNESFPMVISYRLNKLVSFRKNHVISNHGPVRISFN